MREVTVRELRNQGGVVLDRVAAGERLTVTRGGVAVAELRPIRMAVTSGRMLVDRRRRLPPVDPSGLRRDTDTVLDPRL